VGGLKETGGGREGRVEVFMGGRLDLFGFSARSIQGGGVRLEDFSFPNMSTSSSIFLIYIHCSASLTHME